MLNYERSYMCLVQAPVLSAEIPVLNFAVISGATRATFGRTKMRRASIIPSKKKLVFLVGFILAVFVVVSVYKTPNRTFQGKEMWKNGKDDGSEGDGESINFAFKPDGTQMFLLFSCGYVF